MEQGLMKLKNILDYYFIFIFVLSGLFLLIFDRHTLKIKGLKKESKFAIVIGIVYLLIGFVVYIGISFFKIG